MCQNLVNKVSQSKQLKSITHPELIVLFEDWLEELEDEVMETVKTYGFLDAKNLASKLGLSAKGATFLLSKLRREGKLGAS
jgi:hypothetical protein